MQGMADYYQKLHMYREAQLLFSAIRLKVFSHLDTLKTAEEIADALNYNRRNLALFLKSLSSIGLLENRDDEYKNTEITNQLLNENSTTYIGDAILFKKEMMSLSQVEESVINGSETHSKKDGALLYDFYQLAKVTRNEMYLGRVQSILNRTAKLFQKKDTFRVLDLGGGSGTLALEIAKAYPNSEVVIFEHPNVAPLPRDLIKQENLGHRAYVMEGDFNEDPIGSHYDFIIASGVMDFAHHDLEHVTFKIYNSLNDKGYFYMITHGVSEDYLSPKESIIGWLSGRLKGSDLLTDEKTILQTVIHKGFKQLDLEKTGHLKAYLFTK